jgi:hypothetical protein
MLMWVAREKSPIGSEEAMTPVWYLPQGEKQTRPGALLLPGPHPAAFMVSSTPDGHHPGEDRMMIATELAGVVAEHIAAVNDGDTDAIVATFAEDAYVNDARREFAGLGAIRRWVAKEMVGDKVRIEVREVLDHYGDTIVRGAYDGDFDRAGLPDEIILSNYFSVRDGKIVSLVVILNQPAAY